MDMRVVPHEMQVILLVVLGGCWSAGWSCDFDISRNYLNCSSRGFLFVPRENPFFDDAEGIDLSHNSIERIKGGEFLKTVALKYLDLSHNYISELNSEAFQGLDTLATLNLSGNEVRLSSDVLTPELFEPLLSLQEIRIQNMKPVTSQQWKGVDAAFRKLQNLTRLYIDFPRDFVFGEGFRALSKLTTISTAGRRFGDDSCEIGVLRNSTFSSLHGLGIKELRLINCNIGAAESNAFNPLTTLDTLDISSNYKLGLNQAVSLLHPLRNRNMEVIRLSGLNNGSCETNNHFVLNQNSTNILFSLCVKSLDLSENFVSYVVDSTENGLFFCLEHFKMSFHSMRCSDPPVFNRILMRSIALQSLDISYGFGIPLVGDDMTEYYFPRCKCQERLGYDLRFAVVPASLEKLEMTAISVRLYLSKPFKFFNAKNLRYFSFAYNNLGNCGGSMIRGLDNLTELDLSGIRCSRMSTEHFRHLRNLRKLSLSNSHGLDFSGSSISFFDLLGTLENIDLSGNKITQLHSRLFQNNGKLLEINLANNKLNRLPEALFQIDGLKRLDLSANVFTYLESDEMALIDSWITRAGKQDPFLLILVGNPLQCTCDTILFIRWLVLRKMNLDHLDNYKCYLSNGTQRSVYRFWRNMKNFEVSCVSSTYIIISVVAVSTCLILILSLTGLYRYRLNLRYWLYTRLKPPKDMFSGNEYLFDAFVAYTSEDRQWVVEQVRPNLELHDDPFKLCIHDRDFSPGTPIHENIVNKIRQSRRVLLIISRHFLESMYGPLEIEYAGMKCLDEGRDDIILCVLMEDIPVRQMPWALRNLWHKITFLKWSADPDEQTIFWQRLTDALR